MDNIPDGDWWVDLFYILSITCYQNFPSRYCFECVNKATSERKCIVCGGRRQPPLGKMVLCEICPKAYHTDCYIPPLLKVPRGKWYCHNCISKAPPPKKKTQKKSVTKEKDNKLNHSLQSSNSTNDESMNSTHGPIR